jgi:PAS domain S-box-containing protein
MRLRARILVPMLTLPVASVAVLGGVAYDSGRQTLQGSLGRMFELGAARSLSALDNEVLSLYRVGGTWSSVDRMQDIALGDMDGRIASLLVAVARQQPNLVRAAVADASGRVIAASHARWLGAELRPAIPGADPADACRDDPGPPPGIFVCSYPVRAPFDDAQVVGTLEVAWDLAAVFERVQAQNRRDFGAPDLVLMRRDGTIVSCPPPPFAARVGGSLAPSGSRAASLVAEGRQGSLVEDVGGVPHLVGYARSRGPTGWSVVVLETTAVAFAPVDRLRTAVVALGGSVALVALLLSVLLSGQLTAAVRELEAAARRVAAGDLSVRVRPRSDDEIGSLARSFDQMVRDVERQRAELVDKEYVSSLIAGMGDGLFVVDAEGRVERANPALLRRTGIAPERLGGLAAGSLFTEGDEGFSERVRLPALRTGATQAELSLRGDGGAVVPVIVSAGTLPTRGLVCIVTDITQRKEEEAQLLQARQAAEDAAAAKARFLAVVSHEVRTPLNGIIGITDLLAGTALDAKQLEYLQVLRRSGEALLSLLGDILDYSRMDTGRIELGRVAFDLRQCLFEAADLLAVGAREKDIEVSVLVDERLSRRVVGDPQRLRQVLLNLGSNAVKFTPAGAVVLRAEPGTSPSQVSFSVSDSGPGIPADQLERIFEPFHHVDATSTRRHGGIGLGLAIARQIVGLMGGTITARNDPGGGAVLTFTAELPPVADERTPAPADPAALAGRRVLVVDDNATNRLVLREMLASWRCAVVEASDAWEALDQLRAAAGSPDAIELALVDFQMPEMDGMALAREVRADGRLVSVPLVLLTSIPNHLEVSTESGVFAACLTKPIRQSALLETIASVLARGAGPPRPNVAAFRPRGAKGETGPR